MVIHSGSEYKLMQDFELLRETVFVNGDSVRKETVTAQLVPFEGKPLELYDRRSQKYKREERKLTRQYHFFVNDLDLSQERISFTKNDIIRIEKSVPKGLGGKTAVAALGVSGAFVLTIVVIAVLVSAAN